MVFWHCSIQFGELNRDFVFPLSPARVGLVKRGDGAVLFADRGTILILYKAELASKEAARACIFSFLNSMNVSSAQYGLAAFIKSPTRDGWGVYKSEQWIWGQDKVELAHFEWDEE